MLKINKDFKPVEEDVQPELVWTKWWSSNIDIEDMTDDINLDSVIETIDWPSHSDLANIKIN